MSNNPVTATEILERRQRIDADTLDRYVLEFIQRYRPEDPVRSYHFEADVVHLVGLIYREAGKPYEKMLSVAAGLAGLPHPFPPKP